jgi:hypothetical protein
MQHPAMLADVQGGAEDASDAGTGDAVAAAVTAVEQCLAQAYDRGDVKGVRLLHAVLALLAALRGRDGPEPLAR